MVIHYFWHRIKPGPGVSQSYQKHINQFKFILNHGDRGEKASGSGIRTVVGHLKTSGLETLEKKYNKTLYCMKGRNKEFETIIVLESIISHDLADFM